MEGGGCVADASYHLSTSSTACGLLFCSCLLMFEAISSRAHASGMPCGNDVPRSVRDNVLAAARDCQLDKYSDDENSVKLFIPFLLTLENISE